MNDNKEITVRNIDQSGLPQMIEGIFKNIVEELKEIFNYQSDIRRQGQDIFEKFKAEYTKAERPRILFGLVTSKEVMMRANRYAISQMQRFFRGFNEIENNLINEVIRVAKESPTEFFSAVKSVLAQGNDQMKLPESKTAYTNLMREITDSLEQNKGQVINNERKIIKPKRRNFGEIDED